MSSCPRWCSGKGSACNAGDVSSIPGLGRYSGEENGNPMQYSCWGKPMDRGARGLQSMGVTNQQQAALPLGSCDPKDPMILEVSNREAGWNL